MADADRLGVHGASYGGYMTNWIVPQTEGSRAAAAAASICDLEDARLLPDGEFMANYFREPWEPHELRGALADQLRRKVTTPLLLTTRRARDPRVPWPEREMYRALEALVQARRLYVYPRGWARHVRAGAARVGD